MMKSGVERLIMPVLPPLASLLRLRLKTSTSANQNFSLRARVVTVRMQRAKDRSAASLGHRLRI